jgi:hypothetical protein
MQVVIYGFRALGPDTATAPLRSSTSLRARIASRLRFRWGSRSGYASESTVGGLRYDMLSDTGLWPDHAAVHCHHDPVLLALQAGSGGAL